jgi:hypothetical protein
MSRRIHAACRLQTPSSLPPLVAREISLRVASINIWQNESSAKYSGRIDIFRWRSGAFALPFSCWTVGHPPKAFTLPTLDIHLGERFIHPLAKPQYFPVLLYTLRRIFLISNQFGGAFEVCFSRKLTPPFL